MKNKIIVLGIAPCLEEDLEKTFKLCSHENWDFIAVGLDCSDRIKFDFQHVATYHPEDISEFEKRRKAIKGNLDYIMHSHVRVVGVDSVWPLVDKHPLSGSSAFLAAQVSVGLGYEKVVLCGCPMSGKNLMNPNKNTYDVFQQGWIKHQKILLGKVRSMSGFTKELLGEPEESWING